MKDLSYHILDIVQNSLQAGASTVCIEMTEDTEERMLILNISDNGHGMNANELKLVTDPFFTSSEKKKVGLGIPLLKQNAELTGGNFSIISRRGKGTEVSACFRTGSVDMIPQGNIASTMRLLIGSNPDVDFRYSHCKDNNVVELDTAEIRKELGNISLGCKEVLDFISDFLNTGLKDISVDNNYAINEQ